MSTEIAIKDQIQEISTKTNDILEQNQTSVTNAKGYGQKLIEIVKTNGMSDELDAQLNNFLQKLSTTVTTLQDRRKPITQIFDQLRGMFTSLENEIGKDSSVYKTIQGYRNDWAKKKLEEKRKQEEIARMALEKANEKTELKTSYKSNLINKVGQLITAGIDELQQMYINITVENYYDKASDISSFSTGLPSDISITQAPNTIYHSNEERSAILKDVFDTAEPELKLMYLNAIKNRKEELLEILPGRKKELEDLAKKEKEDAGTARLLREQQQTRDEEMAEQAKSTATQTVTVKQNEVVAEKAAGTMNNLFTATQQIVPASESKSKISWKIEIQHPSALVYIFQKWFEMEGKDMPLDKSRKVTIDRMISYCEKIASKDGIKITNPAIKYVEDVTAINK